MPPASAYGVSTVSIENEIVTTSIPNGPIGLNSRVPFLAISPWSKGGYVNSQVFDHTSVIQFIEKRFGVYEKNISPWRRAVAGDLTSCFNFVNPNETQPVLPNTNGDLPPVDELAGVSPATFTPALSDVIIGIPAQEKGIRPARALPYELDAQASVNALDGTVELTFLNSGSATVAFVVRSGNPMDLVRQYTVEPGKTLSDTWNVTSTYNLSVYGPNGFVRYFNGSIASGAAYLDVSSTYYSDDEIAAIKLSITNAGGGQAEVSVLDAYTGNVSTRLLRVQQVFEDELLLYRFYGWYDLIITVTGDSAFQYGLAGHVETGQDSFSDPALGGLVTLRG
ncbi:MAG TPA: phospholipase domain-containing protein [Candidatus Binataceae bacterium]|nr:phospholipase domain-containing protein [Candidatus Binataceae bacterium]